MTVREITEKTRIPLGLGAALFLALCGTIIWGIRLEGRVNSNIEKIDRLERLDTKIDTIQYDVNSIARSVSRIEGRLERSLNR